MIVFAATLVSCGGETPSGICDKALNALVKKDYKTLASHIYNMSYTEEEMAKAIEQDLSEEVLLKYEIQEERVSADGKEARVTVNMTFENDEEDYNKTFELIKTETEGWKLDVDSPRSFL